MASPTVRAEDLAILPIEVQPYCLDGWRAGASEPLLARLEFLLGVAAAYDLPCLATFEQQVFPFGDCLFSSGPNVGPALRRMEQAGVVPSTVKTLHDELRRSVGAISARDLCAERCPGSRMVEPEELPVWRPVEGEEPGALEPSTACRAPTRMATRPILTISRKVGNAADAGRRR